MDRTTLAMKKRLMIDSSFGSQSCETTIGPFHPQSALPFVSSNSMMFGSNLKKRSVVTDSSSAHVYQNKTTTRLESLR